MKRLFFLIISFLQLPIILLYILVSVVVGQSSRDSVFQSFMQFLSLAPGKIGSYQRNALAHWVIKHWHWNSYIGFGALFSHTDTAIGEGVYIGPQCNIGKCSIGKDTLLGSGVHILSGKKQHDFARSDVPIRDQGGVFEKISIGENCWIGNGAIVMASVGNGSIVAAGAVVVNDVPHGVIVGGNPAKVIKTIKEETHATYNE